MAPKKTKTPPRLRCFVAMAFDRADADSVYDAVEKAMESIGIKTLRVDRIEHNDDIDKRIIQEIEAADLVLADLTYARPSVYFEAGYAQRMVPVIYIARRDHFQDKPEDPNGNLRVHFDLRMRNIIAWTSGHDRTFVKRLRDRVIKVTKPLISQRKAETARKQQITDFNGLSLQHKRNLLIGVAAKHFRKVGYKVTPLTSDENSGRYPYSPAPRTMLGGIAAVMQTRDEFHFVVVHTTPSITKSLAELYRMLMMNYHSLFAGQLNRNMPPKRVLEEIVICSFGSGGLTRLQKNISYVRAGNLECTLVCDRPLSLFGHSNGEIPRQTVFHVIESTHRFLALGQTLSERFT
jgi:nucleoside 2-deoxyribosyltransferase